MKPKLAVVTGNQTKYEEISRALAPFFECEQKLLVGYDEIQGKPEHILEHKLKASYTAFKQPVFVDDTSVFIAALNGFPGAYFKDFVALMKPYEMGLKFAGSRIRVECRVAIMYNENEVVRGFGSIDGDIVTPATEFDQKRELDLFTKADGTDKPMIEYSYEEKNAFSHRGMAVRDLLSKLESLT